MGQLKHMIFTRIFERSDTSYSRINLFSLGGQPYDNPFEPLSVFHFYPSRSNNMTMT